MNSPSHKMPIEKRIATELIRHEYQPPEGFSSPTVGVHKASTIFFPSMAAVRQRDWAFKTTYTYGLHGTPTSFVLEERLATLEGAKHCILAPSGLAAISLVNLALLQQGDRVLLPDNVYGPNKQFAQQCLKNFGVEFDIYDPLNAEDLAQKITTNTKLVWLEAAGSVTMEFPDLCGLLRVCRDRGVLTALDNTWGAGLAFQPFAIPTSDGKTLSVDISIHALTKYPSGGGDVLMGSVCTRDDELHKRIKMRHMQLGLGVGMNDVEALLRALPSIVLRYQAQDNSARQLAQFLENHPDVVQVLHPALPKSPGHAFWKAICTTKENTGFNQTDAAAGIFSFVPNFDWSAAKIDAFCEALTLFRIGYSWGGPNSLVMAYNLQNDRAIDHGVNPLAGTRVIRLCIGLEHPDDLQADLEQAFEQVKGV